MDRLQSAEAKAYGLHDMKSKSQKDHEHIIVDTQSISPQETINTAPPPTPDRRACKDLINDWCFEFLTWLLGTLTIFSMLVLLSRYADKPVTTWSQPLQLTTTLALLAQIAQSALSNPLQASIGQLKWTWFVHEHSLIDLERIDMASRGLEGSLMLLLRFLNPLRIFKPARSRLRASDCNVSDELLSEPPTGTETKLKERQKSDDVPRLATVGALMVILMLGFQAFVQQALEIEVRRSKSLVASPDASAKRALTYEQSVATNRSTNAVYIGAAGNEQAVTDPFLQSSVLVGMLSSLVTPSNITNTCIGGSCTWDPFTTLAVCSTTEDISSKVAMDRNQPVLRLEQNATINFDRSWSTTMGVYTVNNFEFGYVDPAFKTDIASSYTVYFSPCSVPAEDLYTVQYDKARNDSSNWKAYRTSFNLCLQTLNASTTTGTESSTTVLESRILDITNTTTDSSDRYCSSLQKQEDKYCIGDDTLRKLGYAIKTVFNGTASLSPGGDSYISNVWVNTLSEDIFGQDPVYCTRSAAENYEGLVRRMQNVAGSVSNAMRTASNATVYGYIERPEQYFKVMLWWFSGPIIIWLVVTLLFIGTVFRTRRHDIPAWKTSVLAVMQSTHRGGMKTGKVMRQAAKKKNFHLVSTHEGSGKWALEET